MSIEGSTLIDGVSIGGFRSIEQIQRIGPLSKINVFIGPNNSGKSNILQFLGRHWSNLVDRTDAKTKFRIDRQIDAPQRNPNLPLVAGIGSKLDSERIDAIRQKLHRSNAKELFSALVTQPELCHNSDLLWYERIKSTTDSKIDVLSTDDATAKTLLSRLKPDDRALNDIFNETKPNWTGGTSAARLKHIISYLISPAITPQDWVIVPAIRQVAPMTEEPISWCGAGIIDRLAELQNPDHHEQRKKDLFSGIVSLLKDVTANATTEIEIPHHRKTILVHMDGKSLPLESLGTGIHELTIMAATCTTLNKQLICIEEPELHLNPLLQRKFLQYLFDKTSNQYFLTSHSAALLDTEIASVFHVSYDGSETTVSLASAAGDKWKVCRELGYKASDLLQANCIVWVEGPSDRIYINHWIKSFDPKLKENTHYSVMFYGGRLLCHLSADDGEIGEFIALCHLNRHPAIVIDSDKETAEDEMNKTKQRISAEFESIEAFHWVTAGREIENYVDEALFRSTLNTLTEGGSRGRTYGQFGKLLPKGIDKIGFARYVTEHNANLDVLDLRQQIEQLVTYIRRAND